MAKYKQVWNIPKHPIIGGLTGFIRYHYNPISWYKLNAPYYRVAIAERRYRTCLQRDLDRQLAKDTTELSDSEHEIVTENISFLLGRIGECRNRLIELGAEEWFV